MRPSLRLALIALLLTFATSASAVRITPAHSGPWYDPDYTSQGFSFEVLNKTGNGPERRFYATWYTYDDEGAPVWAIGTAETQGNVVEMTMYRAFGGARAPLQAEADDLQSFADFVITFGTCHTATADFTMTDSGESATYHLRRLTQIGATTCTGGMSDEVEPGAEPITIVAQLDDTDDYAGAQGSAKFKLRPAYGEFEIDVRKLPAGDYAVKLDGETRGEIQVTINGNGNGNGIGKGTLVFSSPETDEQPLLDFDPRGMLLEIVDGDGVVALRVQYPDQPTGDESEDESDG